MLWTWQNADVGATPGFSEADEALASIRAPSIIMPGQQNLYFPPEDNEWEVSHMTGAELRVTPGSWGHFAGSGINAMDTKFIDDALKELLARGV